MLKTLTLAGLVLSLGIGSAPAQDSGLPEICRAGEAPMQMADKMATLGDDAHKALMAGMDAMNKDMDHGMTAKDIDVAFICGMIPHHQGAIDMARAELQYGDDAWAKTLAQRRANDRDRRYEGVAEQAAGQLTC